MTTSGLNIGITISISSKKPALWINGITMNAIFLLDLLMKSNKKYNVYLINTNRNIKVKDKDVELPWNKRYKIYDLEDKYMQTDLLIMLGTSFGKEDVEAFKNNRNGIGIEKKVIAYKCGNNYTIEMERALFADDDQDKLNLATWSYGGCDDVWMVPQQEYQNKHYYDLFEEVDSKPVPFVWSPMFIDDYVKRYKDNNLEYKYVPGKKEKDIVSFEPNINVVKYAMIPTLIVESLYRKRKDFLNNYVICSGMKIGVRTGFVTHMKRLHIYLEKKLKVDGRYAMPGYLAEKTDIVVSHQWENPLNYAYLDALYLNYPLVHNAEMIQDGGYFYHDFNIAEGAEKLQEVIDTHDDNLEEYAKECERVNSRYMAIKNPNMIKTYDQLIENLWYPEKHKMSYEYDWKTNLYK